MVDSFVRKRWHWLLAGIVILYAVLALGRALSTQPWNDEAWYASPSLSLVQHGNTGTPLLETTGKFWKGINQVTYWVVPLQFFVQVPWIKLFGFSLLIMRLHAMVWGLIALLAWGRILYNLTGDMVVALTTMLFIACDYQFASQMSLARMDAMALALASLAILSYLELRKRNLNWAIIASQTAVVACGLTHPTAGVPAFVALLFLTVYLDFRRLRVAHLLVAGAPYLLGAAFWGWYISLAPDLFRAQFFGNVTDIDRLGGFAHPLRAIVREFGRYQGMSGMLPGMHPLYSIKLLAVLTYFIGVAGLFASAELRRLQGIRVLLGLWTVYFLCMTFYDNTKEVKYAIHIVCLYDAVLAVWVIQWVRRKRLHRAFALACGFVYLGVSVGGIAYTSVVKDDYHNMYLPTAAFVNRSAGPNDLILAGSEFGFALGFNRNLVDDEDLTFRTHKRPVFIIMSNGYRGFLQRDREIRPQIAQYKDDLIARDYKVVFSQGEYQVLERKDRIAPNSAGEL